MRADKRSVGAVFDHTLRLIAPLFQRPYVWTEAENWDPLWLSIIEVAERRLDERQRRPRPHFLGAIVLDQLRTRVGEVEARQIIDGQQRMTTLQLAIAALRDLAGELGLPQFQAAWTKLCENEIPLSEDPDEKFKVWPTNVDRAWFRRTMSARSLQQVREHYDSSEPPNGGDRRIADAYLYFSRQAARWLGPRTSPELERRMRALYGAIREDLHLVAIDLDEEDDAQLIFETLNALGTPLLPADLVKNYLFHAAAPDEIDRLYAAYWRPLDQESDFWRAPVRQGRLMRPRIDLFLQHYLTLATREEVSATHLFAAFREYAEENPEICPAEHLQRLRTYSAIYQRFDQPRPRSREEVFFYRLEQLDTTTVLPLLLEAFHQMGTPERRGELEQVLDDLESFLVRRAVCGLTPKNYNRLFLDLLQECGADGDVTADAVRAFLQRGTAETNRWPDDQEFSTALLYQPLYNRMVRRRLRMLLEALEEALRSDYTEQVALERQKLQVEHLMPQQWRTHWPLPRQADEAEEAERRQARLHRLGNLTLLTRKLNPSVSNGAWADKIEAILDHSALALNRRLRNESWDEGAIERRGQELAALALEIWPYPAPTGDARLQPSGGTAARPAVAAAT